MNTKQKKSESWQTKNYSNECHKVFAWSAGRNKSAKFFGVFCRFLNERREREGKGGQKEMKRSYISNGLTIKCMKFVLFTSIKFALNRLKWLLTSRTVICRAVAVVRIFSGSVFFVFVVVIHNYWIHYGDECFFFPFHQYKYIVFFVYSFLLTHHHMYIFHIVFIWHVRCRRCRCHCFCICFGCWAASRLVISNWCECDSKQTDSK